MTNEDLKKYLKDPSLLNKSTLVDLEKLIAYYPFVHSFVFLYLYNLHLVSDVRYCGELRRLAPSLADRAKLCALVEQKLEVQEEVEKKKDGFEFVDSFLQQVEESGSLFPIMSKPASSEDYFSISESKEGKDYDASSFLEENEKEKSLENRNKSGGGASLLTETLAQIYIEQGRYEKALNIIIAIKEQNPEKSSYFVDQIRFLKRLIDIEKKIEN